MAIFEDMTLHWKGKDYPIPAGRMLGAIAVLEQHISFAELTHPFALTRFSLTRLSAAYGGVLRYAGCLVEDEEVYAVLFGEKDNMTERVLQAIVTLMMLMTPPAGLKLAAQDELAAQAAATPAPGPSRGNRRAASRSSRNSTRRRSVSAAG